MSLFGTHPKAASTKKRVPYHKSILRKKDFFKAMPPEFLKKEYTTRDTATNL